MELSILCWKMQRTEIDRGFERPCQITFQKRHDTSNRLKSPSRMSLKHVQPSAKDLPRGTKSRLLHMVDANMFGSAFTEKEVKRSRGDCKPNGDIDLWNLKKRSA